MKKTYYILLAVLVCFFVLNSYAHAIPIGTAITLDDVESLIDDVVNWLYRIGLLAATGYIVWAGIRWLSAGSDSGKVDEAKAMLKAGIIGFAIIVGVGVIVATIKRIVVSGQI